MSDDTIYHWLPDGTGLTESAYLQRRSMFDSGQHVKTVVRLSDATGAMEVGTPGMVIEVEDSGLKVRFPWNGKFYNSTMYMLFTEVEPCKE